MYIYSNQLVRNTETGEEFPLSSIPSNWVEGQEVFEGTGFEIKYQIDGLYNGKQEWFNIKKEMYDIQPLSIVKRVIAIPIAVEEVKEDKFYAVEYSGFWNIQTGPYYTDKNILDAEVIGEKEAEQYANLIAELLNKHYGTIN